MGSKNETIKLDMENYRQYLMEKANLHPWWCHMKKHELVWVVIFLIFIHNPNLILKVSNHTIAN
jgi:hypothetical protein